MPNAEKSLTTTPKTLINLENLKKYPQYPQEENFGRPFLGISVTV
jgi:hypothetical protein